MDYFFHAFRQPILRQENCFCRKRKEDRGTKSRPSFFYGSGLQPETAYFVRTMLRVWTNEPARMTVK